MLVVILLSRRHSSLVADWRSAALLSCADYRILDFSLIISPSTTNLPYP